MHSASADYAEIGETTTGDDFQPGNCTLNSLLFPDRDNAKSGTIQLLLFVDPMPALGGFLGNRNPKVICPAAIGDDEIHSPSIFQ
jgi:hypothetical protein